MGGAELFPAGQGGAKKRVNRLIQKFDNSASIVIEIFEVHYDVLIKEKKFILTFYKGISVNKIVTIYTQSQMKRSSYSFLL